MSHTITSIEQLEQHYGTPGEASLIKVASHITPTYRKYIEASPLVALATIGPEGLDCSPRGDPGQVAYIEDEKTLVIPDRRGNNRIDSLRNIVRDPKVSLMFLTPGSNTVIRVNGHAVISVDPQLMEKYAMKGKLPRTLIIVTIEELYFQCARALMRAGLWSSDHEAVTAGLPTAGDILAEMKQDFDGKTYDQEWPDRAKKSMW
ncbi:MAG: flavin-nucleotide-binding protein [Hyphomicrobiales bacterium]|nr:MAG: flavin-nucleotide-binding protein [Hyphomicrobiales bacterium]